MSILLQGWWKRSCAVLNQCFFIHYFWVFDLDSWLLWKFIDVLRCLLIFWFLKTSDYEITNFELHVLLHHHWRKNLDPKADSQTICNVEYIDTVAPQTEQKWFKYFNEGNFNLEDRSRSGGLTVLEKGELQATLDVQSSSSTRKLAEELDFDQKTVWNHLIYLNFVHKKSRQDLYKLKET